MLPLPTLVRSIVDNTGEMKTIPLIAVMTSLLSSSVQGLFCTILDIEECMIYSYIGVGCSFITLLSICYVTRRFTLFILTVVAISVGIYFVLDYLDIFTVEFILFLITTLNNVTLPLAVMNKLLLYKDITYVNI